MKASERVDLIKKVSRQLESQNWVDIDLTLKQFGASIAQEWNGDNKYAYCVYHLEQAEDKILKALGDYLFGDATDIPDALDEELPWASGLFRLFVSHISAHKLQVSELKKHLSTKGIDAFVAHQDIEPTQEWIKQIEQALATCDALAAILTEGFHESNWTDHEIGFSISRRVLIIPVRLDIDPYGFISRYQALTPKSREPARIAEEIFDILCRHDLTENKIAEAIVNKFSNSGSFAEAKSNAKLLDSIQNWTPELLREIEQSTEKNYQIKNSFNVPERVRYLLSKHRK